MFNHFSAADNISILSSAIEVGFANGEHVRSKDEKNFNNCHGARIICLPFLAESFAT